MTLQLFREVEIQLWLSFGFIGLVFLEKCIVQILFFWRFFLLTPTQQDTLSYKYWYTTLFHTVPFLFLLFIHHLSLILPELLLFTIFTFLNFIILTQTIMKHYINLILIFMRMILLNFYWLFFSLITLINLVDRNDGLILPFIILIFILLIMRANSSNTIIWRTRMWVVRLKWLRWLLLTGRITKNIRISSHYRFNIFPKVSLVWTSITITSIAIIHSWLSIVSLIL